MTESTEAFILKSQMFRHTSGSNSRNKPRDRPTRPQAHTLLPPDSVQICVETRSSALRWTQAHREAFETHGEEPLWFSARTSRRQRSSFFREILPNNQANFNVSSSVFQETTKSSYFLVFMRCYFVVKHSVVLVLIQFYLLL